MTAPHARLALALPATKQALAALAPVVVASAIVAAAGLAGVDEPAGRADARLTDDAPSGLPLFDVHDASPNDRRVRRCIVLRNAGGRPGHISVRLAAPPDGGLASHVEMTVERGTQAWATPGAGCRGFRRARRDATFFRGVLQAFATSPEDAVADRGPAVAAGRSRAYRISWSVRDSRAAQGAVVSGVAFVWEMTTSPRPRRSSSLQ
jgi:hypothetical protein